METLYYYLPALEAVRDFMELGGPVLVLIAILTLVMWALIFERFMYMRLTHPQNVRRAIELWESREERQSWHAHQVREELISLVSRGLERNVNLVQTCVALCPLMGLLGTVWGMIEIFQTMSASGTGSARSMASGVAKATVPTMAGMVAALSGVAIAAFLDGKARRERELLGENMTMDH